MKIFKPLLLIAFCTLITISIGHAEGFEPTVLTHNSLLTLQSDTTDTAETKEADLPLEAERIVNISSSEGTWISVDVSPDGQQIAFDLLGDIYTIPFEGGAAEQLTDGMAFDAHPRYSPDGKSLLFTSDRDGSDEVWYMNLETEELHQVTKGKDNRYPSAEWTPSGDYIIAAKGGLTNKLWMYHKDGGEWRTAD